MTHCASRTKHKRRILGKGYTAPLGVSPRIREVLHQAVALALFQAGACAPADEGMRPLGGSPQAPASFIFSTSTDPTDLAPMP